MAKPKPKKPAPAPISDVASEALKNRFPTAAPMLPHIAPDGTIVSPGSSYIPQEPGMKPSGAGSGSGSSSGSGGGSGSGNSGGSGDPKAPLDWRAYLANWGFDQEIVDELDRLFRTYSDPSQASAAALAYIRGTNWYSVTFPGIQEGMKKGVIGNEADYRAYTNRLNDLYSRYYGRNVTADEVSKQLQAGYDVNRVGQSLEGEAYIKANGPDIQYALGAFDSQGQASSGQLQSLGEESAGLDSLVGQQLQTRLTKARQRLLSVFQGTLATPAMRTLNNGRLGAPSLTGGISSDDYGS